MRCGECVNDLNKHCFYKAAIYVSFLEGRGLWEYPNGQGRDINIISFDIICDLRADAFDLFVHSWNNFQVKKS